jgi:HEPN domain-containing protein
LSSPEAREQAYLLLQKAQQDEVVLAKLRGEFEVGDEILGFHAQQAVEKRLKAVLAFRGIEFDRVHSISYLTALLDRHDVDLPACRDQIEELTPWASAARYDDLLDGTLDREAIEGTAIATREWAEQIVGPMSWLSGLASIFKHFAKSADLDHLILFLEGDDEGAVIHLTEDQSVWVGTLNQLAAFTLIGTVDLEGEKVAPLVDLSQYMTLQDGIAVLANDALKSVSGRQALVLARLAGDHSFFWAHASRSQVTNGTSPPDSLSKLLLLGDAFADQPMGLSGFEKPGPDVRFAVTDGVLRLTDLQVELLEQQKEEFREQFGRDPGPGDPVFWKRSADEPVPMSSDEITKEVARGEELGATEMGKLLAAAEIMLNDSEVADDEDGEVETHSYDEVNPLPLFIVLSEAASMEGDLEERCLYAAVHSWAEGHLAAEGHDEPEETDVPISAPPFPHPEGDGGRLSAIMADSVARFGGKGGGVDAIAYAAALGWHAGLEAGERCDGCAMDQASHAVARAMRRGEMGIQFHPLTHAGNGS